MKFGFGSIILCVCLFGYASVALGRDHQAPETLGEFVANMPALTSRPLVSYCALEQPQLRDSLEREYENFGQRILEAAQPLAESLSSNPDFSSPVTPELRGLVGQIGEAMLAQVQKVDSGAYCNKFLVRMRETTVEQLRSQVIRAYDGYRQHARGTAAERNGGP